MTTSHNDKKKEWIPSFAGMTKKVVRMTDLLYKKENKKLRKKGEE